MKRNDGVGETFKQLLNKLFSEGTTEINGWVKLTEVSDGSIICKNSKEGYMANFFLN